jgi:hypothetical protein
MPATNSTEIIDNELENEATALVDAVMSNVSRYWDYSVRVDDYESDEDDHENGHGDAMCVDGSMEEAEESPDHRTSGLDFGDELGKSFECDLAAISEFLSSMPS